MHSILDLPDDQLPLALDGHIAVRSYDLRYVLTTLLLEAAYSPFAEGGQLGQSLTVSELIGGLNRLDLSTTGRSSKRVSDALRSEINKGRVRRIGRSRYVVAPIPQSSRYRIQAHVRALDRRARSFRSSSLFLAA